MYIKQSLPNILNAPAQPAVTSCVLEDLRSRGSEFSSAALFAKRVFRLPCAHDDKLDAAACILQLLRNASEAKIMIAAANVDLLKQLTRIPGIPLISIFNGTKLVVRPPNRPTLDYVRNNEKIKTQAISDRDKSLLERIKRDERAKRPQRTIIRKKRRAKGPNPLSVKRSKKQSRTKTGELKERRDNCEDEENHSTPSRLEMSTISDSVSGKRNKSAGGKRKRERRVASREEDGKDNNEDILPPSKARRRQIPVSNSVEGNSNKGVQKGKDMWIGGKPDATVNSSGYEVNGNSNVPKQESRKESPVANSGKDDANSFNYGESTKKDHNVCGDRKEDSGNGKNNCVSAAQIITAEEAESGKRKKQRKNRRRRPAKKQ
ncbi:rRNA-processing protein Fcf1/Utp23 [Gracilaria domingensis]|nr:rRNA-processing protein Fcf1/Utp23 [Gracilaria domingensis]